MATRKKPQGKTLKRRPGWKPPEERDDNQVKTAPQEPIKEDTTPPAPVPEAEPPEQLLANVTFSKEQHLAETILDARPYSEDELEDILLGIENQGGSYDWIQNMNEFRLPEPLLRLEEAGEQAFRWIDTSDSECMIQISRENFRWVPVNILSHGKYFKKREQKLRFNRHGGIMTGYMLLCWMPGKLHRAWSKQKGKLAQHDTPMERPSRLSGTHNYDPVKEGTATTAVDDGAGNPLYADERRCLRC